MNNENQSILITGGSGFIGANLVRTLVKKKYTVHLFLKPDSDLSRISDILSTLTIHTPDTSNPVRLSRLIKKISPTYIIHLASYGNSSFHTDVHTMINTNIVFLYNLLLASKDVPYKRFINTGSSSEYGFKKIPMSENMMLEPNSYYAATKASGTYLCQVFAREHNKPIITFRLFSVYGPYEDQRRFIPTAVSAALTDTTIPLTESTVRRDFIYIDDVISAYLKSMNADLPNGEIYNIGTGTQYTNDKVIETLSTVCKKKLRTKKGAYKERTWDTDTWVADNTKAKKELGWEPYYTLKKGLSVTLDWHMRSRQL